MGNLPGKVHLKLRKKATPYQAPVQRVRQALHKLHKSELDKLVDQGVLHKLRPDECFEHVSWPVCVKNPKAVFGFVLTLDPSTNSSEHRHVEGVLQQFVGARYFTFLDTKSGFWQLKLKKESPSLTSMAATNSSEHRHVEGVLQQFVGARYFTFLDTKSGFWQLKLKKESPSLTSMAAMFGHYCWQKLPFGLSCSSILFNAKL